jgi:hypothetical protein
VSIRDALLPLLRAQFPDHPFVLCESRPEPTFTFPPRDPEVGPIMIWDDEEEATVVIGHYFDHFHIEPWDRSLSADAAAEWIAREVCSFLHLVFSDRVLIWSDEGRGGGLEVIDGAPKAGPQPGRKYYLWSGPLKR